MKRILAVTLMAVMVTGCASPTGEGSYGKMLLMRHVGLDDLAEQESIKLGLVKRPKEPTEQASEDCQQIGYRLGTNEFRQCVIVTANNIRNARAQQAIASERNRPRSTSVVCRPWGVNGAVRCEEQ